MKEVLKIEKQRRHDAEGAKDKALHELKHLRKLAEEQKLLERETLMQTIDKLKAEAQEREKLLVNLERYAENLEKNQRFESLRATKAQREMRDTCQKLLDKIRDLEQTVQIRRKREQQNRIRAMGDELDMELNPSDLFPSPPVLKPNPVRPLSAVVPAEQREATDLAKQRPKSSYNLVVLPKINTKESDGANENHSVKPTSTPQNQTTHSARDDILLEELRRNEMLARILAESQLARAQEAIPASLEALGHTGKKLIRESSTDSKSHFRPTENSTAKHVDRVPEQRKVTTYLEEDESTSSVTPDCVTPTSLIDPSEVIDTRRASEINDVQNKNNEARQDTNNNVKREVHLQSIKPTEANATKLVAQLTVNNPLVLQTAQETPTYDTVDLVPMPNSVTQICRPCGDQDMDCSFIADLSAGSPFSLDGMTAGPDEDILWQETPSVHVTSSVGNTRFYRPSNDLTANANNDADESDMSYFSEVNLQLELSIERTFCLSTSFYEALV
ncbi:unnamed protein product [Echinostoma caproni]|uniref:Lebercilin domain-containing protein n=1 Tax=Echinostoma caproni TaxID=27848 RepID=A0A183AC21_9TREM|nr:unnamed protein product [Echinostoma caproni]